jgi:ribosomal protein S18 acetylase RimI-like enzyme
MPLEVSSQPSAWVRVAEFPADRLAVEALHCAFLEVRYDAAFYDALASDPTCVSLVAQVGGELVGVVTARTWSDEAGGGAASWTQRQIDYWLRGARRPGYIMTLGVLSAHRRRGIGALLLRSMGSVLARGHGATELQLHCLESNDRAQMLYAAHGFVVCETLPGYYFINGQSLTALRMRREVARFSGVEWWADSDGGVHSSGTPQAGRLVQHPLSPMLSEGRPAAVIPGSGGCGAGTPGATAVTHRYRSGTNGGAAAVAATAALLQIGAGAAGTRDLDHAVINVGELLKDADNGGGTAADDSGGTTEDAGDGAAATVTGNSALPILDLEDVGGELPGVPTVATVADGDGAVCGGPVFGSAHSDEVEAGRPRGCPSSSASSSSSNSGAGLVQWIAQALGVVWLAEGAVSLIAQLRGAPPSQPDAVPGRQRV